MTGYNRDHGALDAVQVMQHGRVRLLDWVGDDDAVVYAARRSYQDGTRHTSANPALIRRLIRLRHTSPLEHVRFTFEIDCEMFTFAQWVRHRMGSFSVLSHRYSEAQYRCYVPDVLRVQDTLNKQSSGRGIPAKEAQVQLQRIEAGYRAAYDLYCDLIDAGVCREQARMVLPQAQYTNFVWSVDLHNLMNFLRLRTDHHAQWEIRQYAEVVRQLVMPIVPECMAAWDEYMAPGVGAVSKTGVAVLRSLASRLSADEIADALAAFANRTEAREFADMLIAEGDRDVCAD